MLFLSEAENLPFKNDLFDVVFHIGGINFFNDKCKAINEMIRVAKSKTKIVIIDETEKHSSSAYEKIPFIKQFFKKIENHAFTAPTELIPNDMQNVKYEELWNGRFYCVSFIKP